MPNPNHSLEVISGETVNLVVKCGETVVVETPDVPSSPVPPCTKYVTEDMLPMQIVQLFVELQDNDHVIMPCGQIDYDAAVYGTLPITANDVRVTGRMQVNVLNPKGQHLFLVAGDNFEWDGPKVKGDGSVYATPADITGLQNDKRWAFFFVTGHHARFKSGFLTDPWMLGILAYFCSDMIVERAFTFRGGVATQVATYMQYIRLHYASGCRINDPLMTIWDGKVAEEGVFAIGGANNHITVRGKDLHDHIAYVVASQGAIVEKVTGTSRAAGVVVSSPYQTAPNVTPTLVINNNVKRSPDGTGTSGIFFRDAHDVLAYGNTVTDFPLSYYQSPNHVHNIQQRRFANRYNDNTAINWTEAAFRLRPGPVSDGLVGSVTIDNMHSRAAIGAQGSHFVVTAGYTGLCEKITINGGFFRGGKSFCDLTKISKVLINNPDIDELSGDVFVINDVDHFHVERGFLANRVGSLLASTGGSTNATIKDLLDDYTYVNV